MEQKTAIVTGAGSVYGIGKKIAKVLGSKGAQVILSDVNITNAKKAADDLTKKVEGGTFFPLELDVTKIDDLPLKVKEISDKFSTIDILVNNAGVTRPTKFLNISEEEYNLIFDINIKGSFFLTKAVLPYMKQNNYGRIVNISSTSAKRGGGIFSGVHYSASKAAILGFTKALAREVADYGITCNSVVPGFIDTEITKGAISSKQLKEVMKAIPVGRKGTIQDIASTVAFISSNESGYITGEEIDVNGGLHID